MILVRARGIRTSALAPVDTVAEFVHTTASAAACQRLQRACLHALPDFSKVALCARTRAVKGACVTAVCLTYTDKMLRALRARCGCRVISSQVWNVERFEHCRKQYVV